MNLDTNANSFHLNEFPKLVSNNFKSYYLFANYNSTKLAVFLFSFLK